ncbi:sensor histidine kinase [Clostridium sp. 'White wine YQ']|uniref:sensor histidine kinase n=1 Tax=Clostridium sp. 'White wine YQ' TaxID=3027474 RepID=UPI003FCCA0C0
MEGIKMYMNKSVRTKMVKYFILVIFFIVLILNILMINYIKRYYYDSTEQVLKSEIKTSADFYNKYFSYTSLEENIYNNIDVFWSESNAEVQILDTNGKLLMDSMGVKDKNVIDTSDVKKAAKGDYERWIGKVSYYDDEVMAISYPLKSSGEIKGVLRYVISLKEVNSSIKGIAIFFITISLIVLAIGAIISLILAKGIINPIKELTTVAETMASGDLNIRSLNNSKDEIGKLSATLNYMAEELSKREKLKNDFISSVSHELRTPLTAIKGWVITINGDYSDEEVLKMGLGIIEKETERLSNMVEELLDFSRLISGKIALKKEMISIKDIVDYIGIYMTPRANRDNIEFLVNIEENLPEIWADGDRMKQVFINIIDNAFNFTEPGGRVELSISKEKNSSQILIKLKDNGCGIEEDILPKIKEKFVKGKNSRSQNGIGLSICDEIVSQHGGSLEIYSKLSVGTEVVIKLPTAFRD